MMSLTWRQSHGLCDEPLGSLAGESRGAAAVRRLAEELDSIDSALLTAERSATTIAARPPRCPMPVPDLDARRLALEQREAELAERERRVERLHANLLELHARVARGRDALARTLRRLRAEHDARCSELTLQERQVATRAAELLEARRAVLRLECTHKALLRGRAVPVSNSA